MNGTQLGVKVKTVPLSHEAISTIDTFFGKIYLAEALFQIPEFNNLWEIVTRIPKAVIGITFPSILEVLARLSPESRGIVLFGGGEYSSYTENIPGEVNLANNKLEAINFIVNEALEKVGLPQDIWYPLEALIKPLGVPDLNIALVLSAIPEWSPELSAGVRKLQVSGPGRELFESMLIKELTDLSPAEALGESRGLLRQRIHRKISPLSRHYKRYDLEKRIQLWIRNVVYGESMQSIGLSLQDDETRSACREPGEWVRMQIRDASKILGVKRISGRPRKGGVLRYWKLAAK